MEPEYSCCSRSSKFKQQVFRSRSGAAFSNSASKFNLLIYLFSFYCFLRFFSYKTWIICQCFCIRFEIQTLKLGFLSQYIEQTGGSRFYSRHGQSCCFPPSADQIWAHLVDSGELLSWRKSDQDRKMKRISYPELLEISFTPIRLHGLALN